MKNKNRIFFMLSFFSSICNAIVAGEIATADHKIAKSIVALHITNATGKNEYCSAVVIEQDILLTDAHCLGSGFITARLGTTFQYKDSNEPHAVAIDIEQPYIQKEYFKLQDEQDRARFDIAVIKLKNPLPKNYEPAELVLEPGSPSQTYTVSGFGSGSIDGRPRRRIKGAGVQAAGEDVTLKFKTLTRTAYDREILKFDQPEGGLCAGDSGGGVIDQASLEDGKKLKVVALALSAGSDSGPMCGTVSFALRLAPHRNWIARTIEEIRERRPDAVAVRTMTPRASEVRANN